MRGSTLYVTLEPCCHHGRTPPCTDAIIKSGIKKVVVGMRDPDPKVSGRGIGILKKAGLKVRVGVLERECRELNEAYIKHRKTGLPFVVLKMAATLDGKVGIRRRGMARHAPPSYPCKITGPEARQMAHVLRDRADAILVGIGTIVSDNPKLTTRLKGRRGKNPIRVVLDGRLRIPMKSKVLGQSARGGRHASTWIVTTASTRHPKIPLLKKKGAEIFFCKRDRSGHIHLPSLLKLLAARGILTLLVEGGPRVWSAFLRQKLADRLVLFMSCDLLGDRGVPMLEPDVSRSLQLLKPTCLPVGKDLMVEARL